MKAKISSVKVVAYNLLGLGLVLISANQAFAFQIFGGGSLNGSQMDRGFHTVVTYVVRTVVPGAGMLGLGVGAGIHSVSHNERGHQWMWGGLTALGVGAVANLAPGLFGLTF